VGTGGDLLNAELAKTTLRAVALFCED